ncbi:hypothetical protein C8J56DRAFT_923872, partial [Mycena floridula]
MICTCLLTHHTALLIYIFPRDIPFPVSIPIPFPNGAKPRCLPRDHRSRKHSLSFETSCATAPFAPLFFKRWPTFELFSSKHPKMLAFFLTGLALLSFVKATSCPHHKPECKRPQTILYVIGIGLGIVVLVVAAATLATRMRNKKKNEPSQNQPQMQEACPTYTPAHPPPPYSV